MVRQVLEERRKRVDPWTGRKEICGMLHLVRENHESQNRLPDVP